MPFKVTLLAQEWSYNCPSASEATQKNISKCNMWNMRLKEKYSDFLCIYTSLGKWGLLSTMHICGTRPQICHQYILVLFMVKCVTLEYVGKTYGMKFYYHLHKSWGVCRIKLLQVIQFYIRIRLLLLMINLDWVSTNYHHQYIWYVALE